jgi:hypothetical protein
MRSRLRALLQLDNVVPALIIIVALVVSFEPKVLGVEISDRQIILTLFALFGVNAVIERSGHLYRMGGKVDQIVRHLDREISADRILRTRATFQRTETLVADAKRNVTIIGINLQAATDALPTVLELARKRVAESPPNLNLIKSQLDSRLTASSRRRCTLQVVDRVLPVGVIGVDTNSSGGWLIVQHYLTGTPAERAPLIWLRRNSDLEWFSRYLDQCHACFDGAREW